MQELIEKLSMKSGDSFYALAFYHDNDEIIKEALKKEKEQMIGCCLVGYLFEDGEDTNPFELAEKFYNQTYNQNK